MLDSAEEAVEFAVGKSRNDLDDDRKLLLAIIKSIEIMARPPPKSVKPAKRKMIVFLGKI